MAASSQPEPRIPDDVSLPAGVVTPEVDARASYDKLWGLDPEYPVRHVLWRYLGKPFFRITFHNWYRLRAAILRAFGADIAPTARVRPSAEISHPWNLVMRPHSSIGDYAVIFSLGRITLGHRTSVSQYAHLCAAGHDYTRASMPLIANPIVLEDDVWVAADVFVGPGVTIHEDSVVGARSTVCHSLPPRSVCAGDNAAPRSARIINWPPPETDAVRPRSADIAETTIDKPTDKPANSTAETSA
ncbi:MAG: hypothetical protein AAF747_03420 [Planctomycetota bacterium]